MAGAYDDQKHIAVRLLAHHPTATGLSIPGTAASDTVLLRIPLAGAIRVTGTARLRMSTGGTAAGPTLLFCKSLAGTATAGTANAFGTWVPGTSADGTPSSCALTTTDFAAGDEIVLVNKAGTAAATPVVLFSIPYVEYFQ